jgi:hypothetical protein
LLWKRFVSQRRFCVAQILQAVFPKISFLLPARYHEIHTNDLGRAMVMNAEAAVRELDGAMSLALCVCVQTGLFTVCHIAAPAAAAAAAAGSAPGAAVVKRLVYPDFMRVLLGQK